MLNTVWKSPAELDHQLPGNHHDNDNSLVSRLGLRNVVIFFSSRVRRGGSKLVLQVAVLFLTTFILFGLLPERLLGGGLYKSMLFSKPESLPEPNLRIVVFGSSDIEGSAADDSQLRRTWTEELCDELNCTSHISLVPSGFPNRGLVNTGLYEEAIQGLINITRDTDISEKPALDYSYLAEQYPAPSQALDLSAQVQEFLAMAPSEDTPSETLWIFTFGTWEIWNMAAMPRDISEPLIISMIDDIFTQAELLYRKSLDPTSIAYSDFWTNATESQVKELTDPKAIDNVDKRRFESFRVLIPTLFDISLTPGWRGRAKPPVPNNLAEQTRNAAELTRYWNMETKYAIAEWKQKATQKPEEAEGEKSEESARAKRDEDVEDADKGNNPQKANETEKPTSEQVILAPYPMRNGFQPDPAKRLLDALTEEEMQRSDLVDSQGRGTLLHNDSMHFPDVWIPCIKGNTDDLTVDTDMMTAECQVPDDHLFYDSFTISDRAAKGLAKVVAEQILENMFDRSTKSSWLFGGGRS
ncbi:hypothetical protein FALBO_8340 [Fusarium albosuccineum]|uniref:Uncharacterized protein n=1 Tax=Fusarium albosuccineum TaxID=1237068 RepID=A0A8H4LAS9_9HYPO|nr:hypothetical protein FALBO_8340 [Fusarium albosuccineum]